MPNTIVDSTETPSPNIVEDCLNDKSYNESHKISTQNSNMQTQLQQNRDETKIKNEEIKFQSIENKKKPTQPVDCKKSDIDLSLFESKYNFKYRDVYYRLIIQNDKTVADLKKKIGYKINLSCDRVGLSLNDVKPDMKITDKMTIVDFNNIYKFAFFVFDLNDFNSVLPDKTSEKITTFESKT